MHLEVIEGDRVGNALHIAVNGIFMTAFKIPQSSELFDAELDVGFLDQVVDEFSGNRNPAGRSARYYSRNKRLEATNKFLPWCSLLGCNTFCNQLKRPKLAVVNQGGS